MLITTRQLSDFPKGIIVHFNRIPTITGGTKKYIQDIFYIKYEVRLVFVNFSSYLIGIVARSDFT